MVDDVQFAIVARRVRPPVGDRRLVAVARADKALEDDLKWYIYDGATWRRAPVAVLVDVLAAAVGIAGLVALFVCCARS